MKRSKIALAAFAVVATVGSAFAVKSTFFADASVYCEAAGVTTCTHKVNFRVEPTGGTSNPCGIPGTTARVLKGGSSSVCTATTAATKFTAVINTGR